MQMTDHLLIIDDDTELCQLLAEYLKPEGFDVTSVHEGNDGLLQALSKDYALVVLDIMLPGLNGLEILQRIRHQKDTPVLMLTARDEDVDRIVGLEMGADDYMPKPFNPRELVARIRAILRRTREWSEKAGQQSPMEKIVVGDVEMDIGSRTVRRAGEALELTSIEFNFLEMLLRSAGQVVTRESLTENVLGRALTPYDRSVDVHLSSLRKKLGHKLGEIERIKTVRGVGYIYAHPSQPNGKGMDD
jgi:two-component system response regulator CpxR